MTLHTWSNLISTATAFMVLGGVFFASNQAHATTGDVCDRAAEMAARETGVPVSILRAITRTETGRTRNGAFEPWPWATNTGGEGRWFDSKSAALRFATSTVNRGITNIDIGCFQLNYRWHGEAFSNLSRMFDPLENARYAAEFLTELRDEKGDWMRAVGAYHSRTQKHAARYKRRFSEIHEALPGEGRTPKRGGLLRDRPNRFPLLQRSDAQPRLGSLVPLGQSSTSGSLFSQSGEI